MIYCSNMSLLKTAYLLFCRVISDDTSFDTLKEFVSEKTLKAVSDMGFTNMTEIQHKSIPPLLNGRLV